MKNKAKKYTEKQIKDIYATAFHNGRMKGINEAKHNEEVYASKRQKDVILARQELINKLLSTSGQFQECITKLVMAAEKQL